MARKGVGSVPVSDVDEDTITIDHLLGKPCILNSTVKVTVRRHEKTEELILSTGPGDFFYIVVDVLDMHKNGAFTVKLKTPSGRQMPDLATLIMASLG